VTLEAVRRHGEVWMATVEDAAGGGGEARYGAEVRSEVCARLEAGESLRGICADPRMPAAKTVHEWARRDEAFAAAKRRAQRAAWRRVRLREVEAEVDRTARLALEPGALRGRPSSYTVEMADAICQRIAHGEGIAAICRDDGMPGAVTVYAWLRRWPEFAEMYARAREIQAHHKFDLAWEIARAAKSGNVEVARLQIGVIRWQAARLAPHKYGERLEELERPQVEVRIRKWGENDWADLEAAQAQAQPRPEGPWD
jgi:hypothetical protein